MTVLYIVIGTQFADISTTTTSPPGATVGGCTIRIIQQQKKTTGAICTEYITQQRCYHKYLALFSFFLPRLSSYQSRSGNFVVVCCLFMFLFTAQFCVYIDPG